MKPCLIEQCTGCMVCANICPEKCITLKPDILGFLYPEIDESKCIHCNLCVKHCHINNNIKSAVSEKCYAAIAKDEAEYNTSTSGGIATVVSQYIIEKGGVVYGCTGTNGTDIKHIRIDQKKDLNKLKGSKYVESNLSDILPYLKADVASGKPVLFIGTPCQVSGIKSYLRSPDNLFTIDLICHGTPSRKLLKEHLETSGCKQCSEITFREGTHYTLKVKHEQKVIYKKSHLKDLYYIGFTKSLFLRHSCYNCLYSTQARCSDITLGDFWGLKNQKFEAVNGISLVILNTNKGEKIFCGISELIHKEVRKFSEALEHNPRLLSPVKQHKNTKRFRKLYPRMGFRKASQLCLIPNIIKYRILDVYQRIKK